MTVAELNGKIPTNLQNSEDLLTSSVMGTFHYLSNPKYIQQVLEAAVNVSGEKLEFQSEIMECSFLFWPRLEQCEPDVLLSIKTKDGQNFLVGIEAKYWSNKSSNENTAVEIKLRTNKERDQLAREIEDLHKERCLKLFNIKSDASLNRSLIYLTNHTALPRKEMSDSILNTKPETSFKADHLYWVNWTEIHNQLSRMKGETQQDDRLLHDLKALLVRKGLQSFKGFQNLIHPVPSLQIAYKQYMQSYDWDIRDVRQTIQMYGGR